MKLIAYGFDSVHRSTSIDVWLGTERRLSLQSNVFIKTVRVLLHKYPINANKKGILGRQVSKDDMKSPAENVVKHLDAIRIFKN